MIKEPLPATAQIAQVAFAGTRAQQTGAWALAPTQFQVAALAAFLSKGVALVQAKLQLPKREHHFA